MTWAAAGGRGNGCDPRPGPGLVVPSFSQQPGGGLSAVAGRLTVAAMGTPQPHYMRYAGGGDGGGGFRGPPLGRRLRDWRGWQWLLAANVAAYAAQLVGGGTAVLDLGAFTVADGLLGLQLWRWVTSLFLHWDEYHLIVNLLGLWVFAPIVENRLGTARFLAIYFASGVGAIVGYLLLDRLGSLDVTARSELAGASGCLFGVVVAAAHLDPNRPYRLVLPPVTVRLATIAWAMAGLAVLAIARRSPNAGGEAAHLGGSAVGFVLVRNLPWLAGVGIGPKPRRFWRPGDPASHFFRQQ